MVRVGMVGLSGGGWVWGKFVSYNEDNIGYLGGGLGRM